MTEISFDQLGIGSVLKQHRLVIPPNQREYAWTEKQVTTLFQDFSRAINDAEEGYFLGTIVTIPRSGGDYLEVVDGQQRLATTAILLAAIRDYLEAHGETILVESINNEFLTVIDRTIRERIPRLKLNVDDNECFKAIITQESDSGTRSSHERLKSALTEAEKHIKQVVASYSDKDHADVLDKWIKFIEKSALVILLRVSNDSNAYKMFETLNDRGLKTSQSDLVKNYLFGRAGDRIEEAKQKWAYMRGSLESFSDDDITVRFLRHALMALQGYVKESSVYDEVQTITKSPATTITLMSNLELLSNAYAATHQRDHEKWNGYSDSTRKAIDVLNLFDIKPIRPLMLSIAHKFPKNETEKSLKLLISICVRIIIAGTTTTSGSVEVPLAQVANKVYLEEIKTSEEIKKALREMTPNDEQFRLKFEIATVSNAKFARYFLRSLEMAAKDEKEPWLIVNEDAQAINLEHILPKKHQGNYPAFSDDDAKTYLKRIGNLALLKVSSNSNLKSDAFSVKKDVFATSPFVTTKQIADVDDWTPVTISERQKTLARLAVKAWPL